jgi:hypothetical protein
VKSSVGVIDNPSAWIVAPAVIVISSAEPKEINSLVCEIALEVIKERNKMNKYFIESEYFSKKNKCNF